MVDVAAWLKENHDALEVVVWALGLVGLWITANQLREGRNQRSISETFDLHQRLDTALAAWHACANEPKCGQFDRQKRHADLLSVYELICDAINRGMLTRMARSVLTSQINSTLCAVYSYPNTKETHVFLCNDPKICSAIKWFLIDHWRAEKRDPRMRAVSEAFLSASDLKTFGAAPHKFVSRRLSVMRIWLFGK